MAFNEMRINFPDIDFGLYRDDGLGSHKRIPKPVLERTKKAIIKMFQGLGLKITIETNMTEVIFLDITLNLHKDEFKPYSKPNNVIKYIYTHSNHPPSVIKQVPPSVNKRLNEISQNATVFNNAKPMYERALKESGHNTVLTYQPDQANNKKGRNRNRKVIWFNPPFNKNLKTNIGREFLHILDRNFPPHHPLHKLLNRKTVKISYSCTTNIGNIMQAHNKKLLSKNNQTTSRTCNCRNKDTCPVPGKCCTQCVVYKAEITTDKETISYIGSTGGEFKTRYNGHTQSFRSEAKKAAQRLPNMFGKKSSTPPLT